ncbi:MAG: hypothetical protein ACFFAN_18595 [Promethearchaeota archaeon]
MPEQDLFKHFIDSLKFDVSEYLDSDSELSVFQKKIIEEATFILEKNIIGDIKKFGGNLEKNKEKFENFVKASEKELENDKYKDSLKELKQMFKDYIKKLRELIVKTCLVIIPVKELPWVDVIFRTIPRIIIDKKKINLLDNAIAYYGEINCIISRTTIYGKMKDKEPLFAPFMGELDLGGYTLDESQKGSKSNIFAYISAVIDALDSTTTKSQLAKYHEGYQRHGDPICDFLMKNNELLSAMEKVCSGLESNRIKTDIAICGIAIPLPTDNSSLLLVIDESKDSGHFSKCFEGLLRFSAACCEAPSTVKESMQMQQADALSTPGGENLKAWTQEELAQAAKQRGINLPPGMETWTEEDLIKLSEERSNGIPEGMEVWTEEDLQELSRKRQGGGLDIPEWESDPELTECLNCGYSLRKGWSECPICETPVGSNTPPSINPPLESEPDEIKEKQDNNIHKTKDSELTEPSKKNNLSKNDQSSENSEFE